MSNRTSVVPECVDGVPLGQAMIIMVSVSFCPSFVNERAVVAFQDPKLHAASFLNMLLTTILDSLSTYLRSHPTSF